MGKFLYAFFLLIIPIRDDDATELGRESAVPEVVEAGRDALGFCGGGASMSDSISTNDKEGVGVGVRTSRRSSIGRVGGGA